MLCDHFNLKFVGSGLIRKIRISPMEISNQNDGKYFYKSLQMQQLLHQMCEQVLFVKIFRIIIWWRYARNLANYWHICIISIDIKTPLHLIRWIGNISVRDTQNDAYQWIRNMGLRNGNEKIFLVVVLVLILLIDMATNTVFFLYRISCALIHFSCNIYLVGWHRIVFSSFECEERVSFALYFLILLPH